MVRGDYIRVTGSNTCTKNKILLNFEHHDLLRRPHTSSATVFPGNYSFMRRSYTLHIYLVHCSNITGVLLQSQLAELRARQESAEEAHRQEIAR